MNDRASATNPAAIVRLRSLVHPDREAKFFLVDDIALSEVTDDGDALHHVWAAWRASCANL
jgi:hypothetical protein